MCDDGFKKVGGQCQRLPSVTNGKYIGSYLMCDDGFKKVGGQCQKLPSVMNKENEISRSQNSFEGLSDRKKVLSDIKIRQLQLEELEERERQIYNQLNQLRGRSSYGANISGKRTYQIEDDFDGCEYDKYYPLTNGMFVRCDQYKYFYKYRPLVLADGNRVYSIDGREIRGTIVSGQKTNTQIDGDWEGCDFNTYRLMNGYYLFCNSYFYEYAFMPSVEIIVIDGSPASIIINGTERVNEVSVGIP